MQAVTTRPASSHQAADHDAEPWVDGEFGIASLRPQHISKLLVILATRDPRIPAVARTALNAMATCSPR
jgi:hypothetical protein